MSLGEKMSSTVAMGEVQEALEFEKNMGGGDSEKSDTPVLPVAEGGKLLRAPVHLGTGSWLQATFHMLTAVPLPAAMLALPHAMSRLGWTAGTIALVAGGCVTFYTACLLASLNTLHGKRHARYRDLAYEIWGTYGSYFILAHQLLVIFGSLMIITIPSGMSFRLIYQQFHPHEGPTVQEWIIVFGALQLIISVLPNMTALRYLTGISAVAIFFVAGTNLALSIYNGCHQDRATISYEVGGSVATKTFQIFNALAVMGVVYGNSMLVEIQATVKEPVVTNMYKSISTAYAIILPMYFATAVSGYWAFGYNLYYYIPYNYAGPRWLIVMMTLFVNIQLIGAFQFYCQLIYEYFETKYGDFTKGPYARRNIVNRVLIRSIVIISVCFVGCMFPFLPDVVAFLGAIGYTPMAFIIPIIMYLQVYEVTGWKYWVNIFIASFYAIVGILGAIGSIRGLVTDSYDFHLFANFP